MTDTITLPRSVVEQALKALEKSDRISGYRNNWAAVNSLIAALEQPQVEQEPVAWRWIGRKGWVEYGPTKHDLFGCEPLYLHSQPPRQPLTEMEIVELRQLTPGTLDVQFVKFARAIERAHGIGGEV